ncbi:UPF0023 family protein [Penicillium brasilianum]|uniref:UPF0023 family protein n=1 Tax=Penicillium brasilianum TaxID=104259 RepID=A0A1S9RP29_PENBI|nr:UPF0023 family protein [Penicillium brasilianum]
MPINQPSNQIKFTNVSIVRLKKGKKRFELACYKNKLLEYRSGAEKDLDNVLQVPTVFLSVSKAQTAPSAELTKAFGADTPREEILQEILRKGEVQVGERERKDALERVEKEVLDIVSGRLVDPNTKRVYTSDWRGKWGRRGAAKEAHVDRSFFQSICKESSARRYEGSHRVATNSRDASAHAPSGHLPGFAPEAIRQGCPERCACQGREGTGKRQQEGGKGNKKSKRDDSDDEAGEDGAEAAPKAAGTVKDVILNYIEAVESQEVSGDEWEVVGFAEPGAFKGLNDIIANETRGRGRVEVLDMSVTHED